MGTLGFILVVAIIVIQAVVAANKAKKDGAPTVPPVVLQPSHGDIVPQKPSSGHTGQTNQTVAKPKKQQKPATPTTAATVHSEKTLLEKPPVTNHVSSLDINDADEVRRAIIWSEILNRKY